MVRPSACELLRLMIRSYFVGAWTIRQWGLSGWQTPLWSISGHRQLKTSLSARSPGADIEVRRRVQAHPARNTSAALQVWMRKRDVMETWMSAGGIEDRRRCVEREHCAAADPAELTAGATGDTQTSLFSAC
jgi:hypothetical protein